MSIFYDIDTEMKYSDECPSNWCNDAASMIPEYSVDDIKTACPELCSNGRWDKSKIEMEFGLTSDDLEAIYHQHRAMHKWKSFSCDFINNGLGQVYLAKNTLAKNEGLSFQEWLHADHEDYCRTFWDMITDSEGQFQGFFKRPITGLQSAVYACSNDICDYGNTSIKKTDAIKSTQCTFDHILTPYRPPIFDSEFPRNDRITPQEFIDATVSIDPKPICYITITPRVKAEILGYLNTPLWAYFSKSDRHVACLFIARHVLQACGCKTEIDQIYLLEKIFSQKRSFVKNIIVAMKSICMRLKKESEWAEYIADREKTIENHFRDLCNSYKKGNTQKLTNEIELTTTHQFNLPLGPSYQVIPVELCISGLRKYDITHVFNGLTAWCEKEFPNLTPSEKQEAVNIIQNGQNNNFNAGAIWNALDDIKHNRQQRERVNAIAEKWKLGSADAETLSKITANYSDITKIAIALLQPIKAHTQKIGIDKGYVYINIPIVHRNQFCWFTLTIPLRTAIAELNKVSLEHRASTWIDLNIKQAENTVDGIVASVKADFPDVEITESDVSDAMPKWNSTKNIDNQHFERNFKEKLHRNANSIQAEQRKTNAISHFCTTGSFIKQFKLARTMKRKFITLLGPTNSGKTQQALNSLSTSKSGVYLAPLRLLALEKYEELNASGIPTSLITGEERVISNGNHESMTVEMVDLDKSYAVAIIDEVQMLLDKNRGGAWLNAICGVAAETVYVTGPAYMEKLIRELVAECGDSIRMVSTQRNGTLEVIEPVEWPHIKPLSAIVAFSRDTVLDLKSMLEADNKRVAVLYGSLSAEARKEQARMFREGKADVLVTTDVIGMGLNLPIETLYFWSRSKYDGYRFRDLLPEEVQQIAGRAGRGLDGKGFIGSFSKVDWSYLTYQINYSPWPSENAHFMIFPAHEHIKQLSRTLQTDNLITILKYFREELKYNDKRFKHCVSNDIFSTADIVEDNAPLLPVEIKYTWATAPAANASHQKDAFVLEYFKYWLQQFADGKTCSIVEPLEEQEISEAFPWLSPLEIKENKCTVITLYRWLHWHFPNQFPDIHLATERMGILTKQVLSVLDKKVPLDLHRIECRECGRAINLRSEYNTCPECHQGSNYALHDEDCDEYTENDD